MGIVIDEGRVLKAITDTGLTPTALEAGAQLVQDWINANYAKDTSVRTVAVELGFVLWADSATLVVGVMDRIAKDAEDYFGTEWKSTREPSRWWTEEKWLDDITSGPQLATYALALHEAAFLEHNPADPDHPTVQQFFVDDPRIMVRAAVKTRPTEFWPTRDSDAMYRFPNAKLKYVKNGLVNMGAEIRSLRKGGRLPWQLTGKQCVAFNRQCELFESCSTHRHPTGVAKAIFDPSDPAAELALKHVEAARLTDPDLVVLSASAYQTAARCKELYRVQSGAFGGKEENLALQTGSVMHAGLASYFRQIKEQQDAADSEKSRD